MRKRFGVIKLLFFIIVIVGLVKCWNVLKEGYNIYNEKNSEIALEEKVKEIRQTEGYLTYDKIPSQFVNALVAVEDHRFFEHSGIDIVSIGRAFITDIKEMDLVEGGSTITQQLAKNMYYTQEKKFSRKVAEIFTAFDLEEKYSKEEIMELYINIVYFGNGYYGLYNASNGYFSKTPDKLSLYEITLLAGLPNAPSVYALNNEDNELAIKRQDMVIDAMVQYEYIDENKADELKNLQNSNNK